MDFNLNDEQELFVAGIRELMASENWEAYFAECDRDSVYPERFVKALADMGIDSLLIPEEHGGLDAGFVTLAAVWMELGRLGAPTYVLFVMMCASKFAMVRRRLPGLWRRVSCVKVRKSRSTRSWLSAAPVSRCGTQRLPNRAQAPTWVA